MLKKIDDNIYRFNVKGKIVGVEMLNRGTIEIYEEDNPSKTGFIFDDIKQFIAFINNCSDIAEELMEE